MWRLVEVDHVRCSETDGSEYFLVPPEWTEEEIEAKVDQIVTEMIADAKVVQQAPENPGYGPKFEDHPDLTVKQIKEDFAKRREAYTAWRKENDQLTRSFYSRAEEVGFAPLWKAARGDIEGTGAINVSAYYGHNHGLSLKYKMWEPIG